MEDTREAPPNPQNEEIWRAIVTGQDPRWRKGWHLRRMIPSKTRCKNCNAPFEGIGAWWMQRRGRGQYHKNPHFCNY